MPDSMYLDPIDRHIYDALREEEDNQGRSGWILQAC